ncbi:MAG TPA: hypothetical protein VFZ81_08570 [Burkholderiales bacterium]
MQDTILDCGTNEYTERACRKPHLFYEQRASASASGLPAFQHQTLARLERGERLW